MREVRRPIRFDWGDWRKSGFEATWRCGRGHIDIAATSITKTPPELFIVVQSFLFFRVVRERKSMARARALGAEWNG